MPAQAGIQVQEAKTGFPLSRERQSAEMISFGVILDL